MSVRPIKVDEARAQLAALADEMRRSHLDYYAEHIEYVVRDLLPRNRVARQTDKASPRGTRRPSPHSD